MSQSDLCPSCPLHLCAPWRPKPKRRRRPHKPHRPMAPLPMSVTSADASPAPTCDGKSSSSCAAKSDTVPPEPTGSPTRRPR